MEPVDLPLPNWRTLVAIPRILRAPMGRKDLSYDHFRRLSLPYPPPSLSHRLQQLGGFRSQLVGSRIMRESSSLPLAELLHELNVTILFDQESEAVLNHNAKAT
eukprot:2892392-Rhodomonas_salina.1